MHKSIKIHLIFLVSAILFPNKYADSQQIETPGEVYRELTPKIPDLRQSKNKESVFTKKDEEVKNNTLRFKLSGFDFIGNKVIDDNQLLRVTQKFLNKNVSFQELKSIIDLIEQKYDQAGWLVKISLPPQDITNGIVKLVILEGRVAELLLDPKSKNINDYQVVIDYVFNQTRKRGSNLDAINRGLLLVNDLPGIDASASMRKGHRPGELGLMLKVNNRKKIKQTLSIDNTGSRSIGSERLIYQIKLGNVLNKKETSDLSLLKTEGLDYFGAELSFPLFRDGLSLGISASNLDYEVVTNDTNGIDRGIKGESSFYEINFKYPIIRKNEFNVNVKISHEIRKFDGFVSGQNTNKYKINTNVLSFYGNRYDDFIYGGESYFSLSYLNGDKRDKLTPLAREKSYSKIDFNFGRIQDFNNKISVIANVSGQYSGSEALDVSDFISMGGFNAVRAYPRGEGSGSKGFVSSLQLNYLIRQSLILSPFIDYGQVENKSQLNSKYDLSGAGLAVSFFGPYKSIFNITYARRFGENPNRLINGNDQDGKLVKNRFWFSLRKTF